MLPIAAGLDGASLKPFIKNQKVPVMKMLISQYPHAAGKAGSLISAPAIPETFTVPGRAHQ
jgi:hypothetical protein